MKQLKLVPVHDNLVKLLCKNKLTRLYKLSNTCQNYLEIEYRQSQKLICEMC